ncbi:ribonuclease H-like domain-containing protein [Tanacetum coccineum]
MIFHHHQPSQFQYNKPHTKSLFPTSKLPILKEGNGPVSVSTDSKWLNKEGWHKGYDRFQSLLSQLEIHGAGRKLQFDAKEPVGFDKTKVECYSCHKTGHFARECRFKGNQDSRRRDAWNTGNKDKENERRSGKQEDSKALVTLNGEGVD